MHKADVVFLDMGWPPSPIPLLLLSFPSSFVLSLCLSFLSSSCCVCVCGRVRRDSRGSQWMCGCRWRCWANGWGQLVGVLWTAQHMHGICLYQGDKQSAKGWRTVRWCLINWITCGMVSIDGPLVAVDTLLVHRLAKIILNLGWRTIRQNRQCLVLVGQSIRWFLIWK